MLHHGDLFDVLPTIGADSVDACVTDPPYGIGFMGREWDTFKPGTGATRKLMHPRERKAAAAIVSDNPNINGRHRSPALSPSQIDYDYSAVGLRGFQQWTEKWAHEVYLVLKPGGYIVVCGAPRSYHRMACGLEDAGFVVRDQFAWIFGSGFPKNLNLGDGKGTALKPAHEPIAVAWKPFKGTITACHQQHGTAALNIDACRVESADPVAVMSSSGGRKFEQSHTQPDRRNQQIGTHDLGRWPANVVLDEEAAAALDEQTGELSTGSWPSTRGAAKFQDIYQGGFVGQTELPQRDANVGGASRFYYIAKPSREERDFGCDGLDARARDDSRKAGNPGGDNPRNRGLQPRGNFHPTVKPVELMRWLVKLVTPRTVWECPVCDGGEFREKEEVVRAVQAMREHDRSGGQVRSSDSVILLESVRGEVDRQAQTSNKGLRDQREGLQADLLADPSKSVTGGLHHGAPACDGGCVASAASVNGGGSSQERRQDGQPSVEPGSDAKASTRPATEAATKTYSVSTLPGTDQGVRTCSTCGSNLRERPGRVLDPFTGSGTTGMACRYEHREFVGIEREADYIAIAERRIAAVAPLFASEASA